MVRSDRILLVEGESDQGFFEEVCKSLGLDARVQVAPPKALGEGRNSKEAVFNILPKLVKQLADGSLKRLAAVVDADYEAERGLGFGKTFARFGEILTDYRLAADAQESGAPRGLVFRHADGLPDVGLWVMPDNRSEGMLEDWIEGCVKQDELALLQHAQGVVAALPEPRKFKQIHRAKAEVATWLAWQKRPGYGPYLAMTDDLLDPDSTGFRGLADWLSYIYRDD
jgi:hypothetical protein